MSKKLIFSSLALILTATALILQSSVKGQETPSTNGLSLSPPSFELSGNPGSTVTNTIRLENMKSSPVRLAVDRRNFTAVGEDGSIGLTEDQGTFSLASWISVDPADVIIPPRSTRTFTFTIKVPLNAEPGGHFGSLIFRTVPENTLTGSGASVAQEVGALILLRIAGATVENAKVESFAAAKSFYEYGPVVFEERVKNLGNVHLKPSGNITITNLIGQKVATVPLETKNVLPGAIRKIEGTWDTKWRAGQYTATAVMIYGPQNTQLANVATFIVFPYRFALIVLVVIFILFTFVYRSRRRLGLAWKILTSGKA
ncbi:MAG: hypothetical protein WCG44_03715 [bacterium]